MLNRRSGQAHCSRSGQAHCSRSGQALIELMPSLVIFLMVISAGLAYFRIMRAGTIRQETVRNLAFAKIDNSGTLTTPGVQRNGGVRIANLFTNDQAAILKGANGAVEFSSACFVVSPKETRAQFEPTRIFGVGVLPNAGVEISSYAVMYRQPAGRCD